MKDANGNIVEIRGWTQYGSTPDIELSYLEIKVGVVEIRMRVDMPSDALVEWCKQHEHPVTDMRGR